MIKEENKDMTYLHTVECLCDFWGIFHFEEGTQVPRGVEELDLKTFVAKSDLTAQKMTEITKNPNKITKSRAVICKKHCFVWCSEGQ